MSHHFLQSCRSRPKTLGELKDGDAFICFPDDGDDSGHGGFRGGRVVHVKVEPWNPGAGYHPDFLYTCREFDRPWILASLPLSSPVVQIHGVTPTADPAAKTGDQPWEDRRTVETRMVEAKLLPYFEQVDCYRANSATIKLRVVDSRFDRLSREERDTIVEGHIQYLPPETVRDIVALVSAAPRETTSAFFEPPSPSHPEGYKDFSRAWFQLSTEDIGDMIEGIRRDDEWKYECGD